MASFELPSTENKRLENDIDLRHEMGQIHKYYTLGRYDVIFIDGKSSYVELWLFYKELWNRINGQHSAQCE